MSAKPEPIWHYRPTLDQLNANKRTLVEHLGIEIMEIGPDYLVGRMKVDHRTVQPQGILHGGASVALAETLGSMAAYLCVDPLRYHVVGLEINANHLRSVKNGYVTGTARPVHLGRSTQVWEIRILDGRENTVCISRLTAAVLELKEPHPA